ncbi:MULTISPECIES: 2-oxo-4-hydroxy-4-carboxy-5-ureidoimidazoline decarboxylase [Pseudanabaena]|uniref:2-oxo-4-hydroxy-4-carboxy-5-ureidoimidazoline decarboxylase n=2 Tax=Pseudanabaena TaxID=1152 RepID=L8N776_9CYAN|nr:MULTISPECIES: 2-oxo-4-hydroxy-4-carboxy-5-ureidoimidazoline decarboxylase [Pseudanabaena]ELS34550.1 OHCU decarboxylase [Pseudanabaena biceps PCC 7429]MDG3493235.1 2-oxo-4-hydroxy-4-carboxy-5-ureidoimidazoline decarboxylase [Pseudanabaena catenata USMAC16]
MSQDEFTEALGSIFEHTPAIATTTWQARPFADIENLHQTMAAIVMKMTDTEKLQLICAHPDLGSKVKMADASVQEQSTIGLDRLSIEEYDRFQQLNQSYKEKFNFPYIIAVRNHTKDTILMNFMERLQNNLDTEKKQAIAEIIEIARWRLILAISN